MDDWTELLDTRPGIVQGYAEPMDTGPQGELDKCPRCGKDAARQILELPNAGLRQVQWRCRHGCRPTVANEPMQPCPKAVPRIVLPDKPKPKPCLRKKQPPTADLESLREQASGLLRDAFGRLSPQDLGARIGCSAVLIYRLIKSCAQLRRANAIKIIRALEAPEGETDVMTTENGKTGGVEKPLVTAAPIPPAKATEEDFVRMTLERLDNYSVKAVSDAAGLSWQSVTKRRKFGCLDLSMARKLMEAMDRVPKMELGAPKPKPEKTKVQEAKERLSEAEKSRTEPLPTPPPFGPGTSRCFRFGPSTGFDCPPHGNFPRRGRPGAHHLQDGRA